MHCIDVILGWGTVVNWIDKKVRFAAKNIVKNEGIEKARGYSKRNAIPRLKQRQKYKKAIKKMTSKGMIKKGQGDNEHYSGENRGIKMGKSIHTNLK